MGEGDYDSLFIWKKCPEVENVVGDMRLVEKPSRKRGRGGDGGRKHILMERLRRTKMKHLFEDLHSMLPNAHPLKTDRNSIVGEAIMQIITLQKQVEKLEHQKKQQQIKNQSPSQSSDNNTIESFKADQVITSSNKVQITHQQPSSSPVEFQTWSSPNVVLSICGREAHFNICSVNKPGLFSDICFVLHKYNIELVSASANSNPGRGMFMIHCQVNEDSEAAEDLFKQAATEMTELVSS